MGPQGPPEGCVFKNVAARKHAEIQPKRGICTKGSIYFLPEERRGRLPEAMDPFLGYSSGPRTPLPLLVPGRPQEARKPRVAVLPTATRGIERIGKPAYRVTILARRGSFHSGAKSGSL